MKLSRPARTRLGRALVRAPIWLYRLGLGGLLGRRFLLLTYTGRKSGRPRQVVLEVVGRHEPSGGFLIASVYVGFAVADGRLKVIAVESSVTFAFVVVAAVRSPDHPGSSWQAWPATDSRTSGSTEATSSPTRDGGRRFA